MSFRPIAYNLVRLIMASIHTTPRGVDRIDFGYLSWLLENWPADVVGVMPTAIGMRIFPREQVQRGVGRLVELWQEDVDADHDPAFARLVVHLGGQPLPPLPIKTRGFLPDFTGLRRMARLTLAEGISFGKPAADMPKDAIYLDVGHYGLTFPGAFRWRQHRPDVAPVFLIHDAIPLELPHMVAEETVRAHHKLMGIVAEQARAIITPTAAAGEAVNQMLGAQGARQVPVYPNPLPIDDLFSRSVAPFPALEPYTYFTICGAVEPRKNHGVLFEVWRRLVSERGDKAPWLAILGSPGHQSAEILAAMHSEPALRAKVVLISGMASPALARVMAGSRAVLMPSFAEGFGLPPVEALALGVPALVSDIPAHREGAGEYGCFLPANDASAWHSAITALLDSEASARERARVATFVPRRWPDHMARVADILSGID